MLPQLWTNHTLENNSVEKQHSPIHSRSQLEKNSHPRCETIRPKSQSTKTQISQNRAVQIFTPQVWKRHTQSTKMQTSHFSAINTCEEIHTPAMEASEPNHKNADFSFRVVHTFENIHTPGAEASDPSHKNTDFSFQRRSQKYKISHHNTKTEATTAGENITPQLWYSLTLVWYKSFQKQKQSHLGKF